MAARFTADKVLDMVLSSDEESDDDMYFDGSDEDFGLMEEEIEDEDANDNQENGEYGSKEGDKYIENMSREFRDIEVEMAEYDGNDEEEESDYEDSRDEDNENEDENASDSRVNKKGMQ